MVRLLIYFGLLAMHARMALDVWSSGRACQQTGLRPQQTPQSQTDQTADHSTLEQCC